MLSAAKLFPKYQGALIQHLQLYFAGTSMIIVAFLSW